MINKISTKTNIGNNKILFHFFFTSFLKTEITFLFVKPITKAYKITHAAPTRKTFTKNGLKIQVHLKLYTEDKNKLSEGYKTYWFDNPKDIVGDINTS